MFGTSGIRGIYGKDITEALACRIASIFAEGELVLGRDIRESGPMLVSACARGASAAGSATIDLGVLPTPTVALATKKRGCRGIMVTASHNPPEYNGLKLIEAGKEIGKPLEREITEKYRAGGGSGYGAAAAEAARYHDRSIIDDHKSLVCSLVDGAAISKKKPKVIVDCNGAGSAITPSLLADLGCRVISLNASLSCFNRPSEPRPESVPYMPALVRDAGADLAILHDGDGDRCVVLDERGEMVPQDAQLAAMASHELVLGRGKVVSTVEASLTVREAVEDAGGEMDITPVGSTFVGDRLEEAGAVFGGEPAGEYIYSKGVHVPDGVLAAAKFAEIFCSRGRLSAIRERYPQHPMAREKFRARDKAAAMERITREVAIEGTVRADDGIRVDEEDGWFLIRASGTEPVVRLTMEYKDAKKLERRKSELSALISRLL
ncbi:MAG: phosphoglucosamine mutase [Candidatus Micrarchaeota archaeon]